MCNSVFVCSGGHRISHCLHSGVGYGISSSVSNFRICAVCSFVAIFDLTKAVLLHDTAICFPFPFHPSRSMLGVFDQCESDVIAAQSTDKALLW